MGKEAEATWGVELVCWVGSKPGSWPVPLLLCWGCDPCCVGSVSVERPGQPQGRAPHSSPQHLCPAHRLEYLHQKQSRVTSEAEKQVLEKQIREAEKETQDIK